MMNQLKLLSKLILVSSVAFFISNCATNLPATEPSVAEMDRANTIILDVDKTPEEAYRQIAQLLNDKGYTFSNTDETLRIISTDYRTNEGFYDYDYKISVSVRENENTNLLIIKGTVNRASTMGGMTEKQAMNTPTSTNFEHLVWNRLKEIAEDFGYVKLMYQRQ